MMQATILYIEDIDINFQLVKRMLKFLPYHLLNAATAQSGLLMAQAYKPNLILMDLNLPDMDGLELMTLMKTSDTLCHIPVIAFTADSSHETYRRCIEAGCASYLNKPISKANLLRVLNQNLMEMALGS